MTTLIYSKDNFMEMDSMHDAVATKISIKDKTLTVEYDNLDKKGIIWRNSPASENKKITVEYEFASYCEAKFFQKSKWKFIDLSDEADKFYKLTNNVKFTSYKYSLDSFGQITLFFCIYEKHKYQNFEIGMDATKITYTLYPIV